MLAPGLQGVYSHDRMRGTWEDRVIHHRARVGTPVCHVLVVTRWRQRAPQPAQFSSKHVPTAGQPLVEGLRGIGDLARAPAVVV